MSYATKVTALLLLSFNLRAQPVRYPADSIPEKIDAYLQSAANAYKFNGVALVAKNGTVLFHKAFGWNDVAAQTRNDTGTRFPILSITKSFTAIVLLKLQEQNLLSLKDPVSKYMPEYPQGTKITLEQLLTHASGIFNYTDLIDANDSAIVCNPVTKQQVLDLFATKPLAFKPGKGFGYNNSAYYLAGMVIEKVTGKPYEQNVRELIFEPLGMTHSGFDYNHLPAGVKATGYQFLNATELKPYPFMDSTVSFSAGAIYSTTSDMYNWAQAIADGKLLSRASWQAAFTPRNNGYGYGFQMGDYQGHKFIKHSGGYPGYVSEFTYYPGDSVTIILLKNSGTYGEDLWPVTIGLSNIMMGLPYELWQLHRKLALPDTVLKKKEGTYASGKKKIRFYVKDQQLKLTNLLNQEIPLFAENEDFFYSDVFYTEFHFVNDTAGDVVKVITHERGVVTEWKKVK